MLYQHLAKIQPVQSLFTHFIFGQLPRDTLIFEKWVVTPIFLNLMFAAVNTMFTLVLKSAPLVVSGIDPGKHLFQFSEAVSDFDPLPEKRE